MFRELFLNQNVLPRMSVAECKPHLLRVGLTSLESSSWTWEDSGKFFTIATCKYVLQPKCVLIPVNHAGDFINHAPWKNPRRLSHMLLCNIGELKSDRPGLGSWCYLMLSHWASYGNFSEPLSFSIKH